LLKKLAQIAVSSRARAVKSNPMETAPLAELTAPATNVVVLPPAEPRDRFAFLPARMRGEEGQRLRVAAAALLLLIMGIAGWLVMRTRSGQARGNQSAHAATKAVPELMAAGNSSESVTANAGQQVSLTLAGPVKPRADLAAGEVVRKAASSIVERKAAVGASSGKAETAAVSPPPSTPEPDAPAPDPSEAISGMSQGAAAVPQAVANPQPVFPFVAVPVSQGVTGGKLTHRVDPVYPAEGRVQRLEGAVVLDALVGEDGRVKQVQVTSGPPTLAKAAMDAVRQWKYEPYLLNGRPVALHNQITIQFRLP
jgi:protein TonB